MQRGLRLFLAGLMMAGISGLAACANMSAEQTPSKLPSISYYFNDLSRTYDCEIEVDPDGHMLIAERRGPTESDVRQVPAQLSPAEMTELLAGFKGWKSLKPTYPGGDWSQLMRITFDGHQVQANSIANVPETFKTAKLTLEKIASSKLPRWEPAGKAAESSHP